MEHPFDQCGSAVPAVCSYSFSPTPAYFWRDRLGKSLSTVQALFSDNQNSGVLSTVLVTNAKKNSGPYRLLWRKLTPSKPKAVHLHRSYLKELHIETGEWGIFWNLVVLCRTKLCLSLGTHSYSGGWEIEETFLCSPSSSPTVLFSLLYPLVTFLFHLDIDELYQWW